VPISAPFFEIGPKNILRRGELYSLLEAAQLVAARENVATIVTTPTAHLESAKRLFPGLFIFAQHMDVDRPGPSVGRVTAEALVDADADGVMLNHSQRPLLWPDLITVIDRAKEVGLVTLVCARDRAEVLAVAELQPDIVLCEPPALIGHAGGADRPSIADINERVARFAPSVQMMHAGGIGTAAEAREVIRSGAAGTGVTTAVIQVDDRAAAIDAFISAVRRGWSEASARSGAAAPRGSLSLPAPRIF
jgi:triosephosphate isomerase (TIM)